MVTDLDVCVSEHGAPFSDMGSSSTPALKAPSFPNQSKKLLRVGPFISPQGVLVILSEVSSLPVVPILRVFCNAKAGEAQMRAAEMDMEVSTPRTSVLGQIGSSAVISGCGKLHRCG